MATPTKIAIGYKNLCLESGVTFTPSTEHASHDADNLAISHPSKFWRMTTLTGTPEVTIASLPVVGLNTLFAALYVTSSPHWNLIASSDDLSHADWTANDCSASVGPTSAGPRRRQPGCAWPR